MRPVSRFTGARENNHGTLGFAGVGRFPERQKGLAAHLQPLLLLGRDRAFEGGCVFLATLRQWLAFQVFFFGCFFRCHGRRVGSLN
ncbi:hypothetical protein D3C72_2374010 [compost metagenome]